MKMRGLHHEYYILKVSSWGELLWIHLTNLKLIIMGSIHLTGAAILLKGRRNDI